MASCYYLALTAWAARFVMDIYEYCAQIFHQNTATSIMSSTVISNCLDSVVPYTVALGSRFATSVALLVWAVPEMARRAPWEA